MTEHVTKKLIFFFIIGMAFRQDHLKIYGNAVVIPGHHKHDEFDPEEPGMVLIQAPFLSGRIFGAPFIFLAAVGNNVEHFIFGHRETFYGFLSKPLEEQLKAPIPGG